MSGYATLQDFFYGVSARPTRKLEHTRPASKLTNITKSEGCFTAGHIAVVKVGKEGVTHRVHKALLVQHSEYFRGALTGRFKEAEEQLVTLTDVDPDVFSVFTNWLYTQNLPTTDMEWTRICTTDDCNRPLERLQIWLKAYVFRDRMLAPAFQHAANEAFTTAILKCDDIFNTSSRHLIRYAALNVPHDRVIYQCLVNSFCAAWDDGNRKGYVLQGMPNLPRAFLWRVTMRFQESSKMTAKEKARKMCYLEHGDEEKKMRCWKLHMRWDEAKQHGHFV